MAFADEMVGISPVTAISIGGQYGAIAALGSSQGNAALVTASMTVVGSADGTKGVILPAANVGEECWVFNNSGSTLKVYPPNNAAIAVPGTGLGSANASYAHTTYAVVIYKCFSSTQWIPNKSA